ncbi:MAG: hypothetical protein KDB80_04725, partial [Planctomycetes bacterium]|nr:hypothetical protein [Planctomycetota bacterium]
VSCVSGEDGAYALGPYPHTGSAQLLVEGPDHPRAFVHVPVPDGSDIVEQDIVVERRDPLRGRVVDQHGNPVGGVEVMLGERGGTHYHGESERTGDDGRFAFPDAVASHDDLWVSPPAPAARWETVTDRAVVDRDAHIVTLHRFDGDLVDLRVEIVDGETGEPAPPGDVALWRLRGLSRDDRVPEPRPSISFGDVTAAGLRPGRYRLIVRAVDGRCADRVIEVIQQKAEPERLELWRPATVVCSLDTSGLTSDETASLGTMLVLLRPSHEASFAVDDRGEALPLTPNTGMFRVGKCESFRMTRVTPNVPLSLHLARSDYFGEVCFTVEPRGEKCVTIRPVRSGAIRFAAPTDRATRGTLEVEIQDAAGGWRPIEQHSGKIIRPPGIVRWRLRFWPADGSDAVEKVGSTAVSVGVTSEVAWLE